MSFARIALIQFNILVGLTTEALNEKDIPEVAAKYKAIGDAFKSC